MAKKTPKAKAKEASKMQAAETESKAERTKTAKAGPKGAGGRPAGPIWLGGANRWVARIEGKQHTAPETIGRSNVEGAAEWYRELLASLGGVPAGVDDLPGTPTASGRRKLVVALVPQAAAELRDLARLVAVEQIAATPNYSRTLAVAVHEALARRRAAKGGRG